MKRWLAACVVVGLATNWVYGQSATRQLHSSLPTSMIAQQDAVERTSWRLSHRLQGGWEYDSNIYESSTRRIASGSARFLLNTRGDRRSPRWQIQYNYSAALQTYPNHGNENKLSHDLYGQAGWRAASWLQIAARANATLKFYLENPVDYGTTSGGLTASFFLPYRFVAEVSGETGQLDYVTTDLYDFTFTGATLTLRRPWSTTGAVELLLNRRALRYERPAYDYNSNQGLFAQAFAQCDALTTARMAITRGRKIVLQMALEGQINRSNSFGYAFNGFRVSGLLGFRPAPCWLLRVAGLLQNKTYRDDLSRLNLRDLDTEREQSNFLILDLSRDLSAEISFVARAAFYDNESTVPGIFYRKTLFFSGVEIRL